MKKRIIIAAAFTACLALRAAMWSQAETIEETPALPQTPAVSVPEATVVELDPGGRHRTEVSTCGNTRSPVRTGARTCPGSVLWSRPGASCRTARS